MHPVRLFVVHPGGLDLAIEGPSKAEISCVDNKDGTCSVTYLPTLPGDYNILVKYNSDHIAGSPFMAKITGETLRQTLLMINKPKKMWITAIYISLSNKKVQLYKIS